MANNLSLKKSFLTGFDQGGLKLARLVKPSELRSHSDERDYFSVEKNLIFSGLPLHVDPIGFQQLERRTVPEGYHLIPREESPIIPLLLDATLGSIRHPSPYEEFLSGITTEAEALAIQNNAPYFGLITLVTGAQDVHQPHQIPVYVVQASKHPKNPLDELNPILETMLSKPGTQVQSYPKNLSDLKASPQVCIANPSQRLFDIYLVVNFYRNR